MDKECLNNFYEYYNALMSTMKDDWKNINEINQEQPNIIGMESVTNNAKIKLMSKSVSEKFIDFCNNMMIVKEGKNTNVDNKKYKKVPNHIFNYINESYIDTKYITYSTLFSDVISVVNSLSTSEKANICNGEFKNSPYVIYREVLLVHGNPAAFIDVYKLPNMKEDGCVVIATNPKYRNNGLAKMLAKRMKKVMKNKDIIWKTQKYNKSSIKLAKDIGYDPIY